MSSAGSPTVVPTEWDPESRRNSNNYETPPSSATGGQPSENGVSHGLPLQTQLEGWPLLAELMSANPGFEAFSRFESLNVKNLLYYQVELKKLENDLRDLELGDILNYPDLHKKPEKLINGKSPQWDDVQKLRKCLRRYNEALLQYAQVSALAHPTTHNMSELVTWMHDGCLGNRKIGGIAKGAWGRYERPETEPSIPSLLLRPMTKPFTNLYKSIFQQGTYKDPYVANLVAPRGRRSTDGLSRWIVEDLIPSWTTIGERWRAWPKRVFIVKRWREWRRRVFERSLDQMSRHEEDEKRRKDKDKLEEIKDKDLDPRIGGKKIQTIHESTILKITTAISTLFACMIPVVAVFLLSIVKDLFHKLAMIACFTFLFGLCLMIVSEVNRVQVFMATSAFLAVLVVFIPVGGH